MANQIGMINEDLYLLDTKKIYLNTAKTKYFYYDYGVTNSFKFNDDIMLGTNNAIWLDDSMLSGLSYNTFAGYAALWSQITLQVATNNKNSGTSGSLYFYTGTGTSTANSGSIYYYSGNANGNPAGITGQLQFQSGNAGTSSGSSGNITINTGTGYTTGTIDIHAGSPSGGTAGNVNIYTNGQGYVDIQNAQAYDYRGYLLDNFNMETASPQWMMWDSNYSNNYLQIQNNGSYIYMHAENGSYPTAQYIQIDSNDLCLNNGKLYFGNSPSSTSNIDRVTHTTLDINDANEVDIIAPSAWMMDSYASATYGLGISNGWVGLWGGVAAESAIVIHGSGVVDFQDVNLTNAIPISQSGTTGLVGFTATSIVGALNELKAGGGGGIWQKTGSTIKQYVAADNLELWNSAVTPIKVFGVDGTTGDTYIEGKLTVVGAIDPTELDMPSDAPIYLNTAKTYYLKYVSANTRFETNQTLKVPELNLPSLGFIYLDDSKTSYISYNDVGGGAYGIKIVNPVGSVITDYSGAYLQDPAGNNGVGFSYGFSGHWIGSANGNASVQATEDGSGVHHISIGVQTTKAYPSAGASIDITGNGGGNGCYINFQGGYASGHGATIEKSGRTTITTISGNTLYVDGYGSNGTGSNAYFKNLSSGVALACEGSGSSSSSPTFYALNTNASSGYPLVFDAPNIVTGAQKMAFYMAANYGMYIGTVTNTPLSFYCNDGYEILKLTNGPDSQNGRVTIGAGQAHYTASNSRCEIFDSGYPQLRLTYSNNISFTDLQTTTDGYFHIKPKRSFAYIDAGTVGDASGLGIIASGGTEIDVYQNANEVHMRFYINNADRVVFEDVNNIFNYSSQDIDFTIKKLTSGNGLVYDAGNDTLAFDAISVSHNSAIVKNILTKTDTDYTITTTDKVYTILVSTGATTRTITLPNVANNTGRIINIKKIDSGVGDVTIAGEGAETIDGNNTKTFSAQWESISVQSDGTAWYII